LECVFWGSVFVYHDDDTMPLFLVITRVWSWIARSTTKLKNSIGEIIYDPLPPVCGGIQKVRDERGARVQAKSSPHA
jgi:hypothetical protein